VDFRNLTSEFLREYICFWSIIIRSSWKCIHNCITLSAHGKSGHKKGFDHASAGCGKHPENQDLLSLYKISLAQREQWS